MEKTIGITEDYVSFEIAKLLKDKGFDEGCRAHYGSAGSFSYEKYEVEASGCEMHNAILAPTLQMAMKWLREVHKIHVVIYPYGDYSCDNYQFDVYKDNSLVVSKDDGNITYEQACKTAIKYCLENLI